MPEKIYRLLRTGIEDWQPSERLREFEEKNKADALAVFELWSRAPWPDLTGLRRVRVVLAEKPKGEVFSTEINAWKISDRLLLLDDFTVRPVGGDEVTPLDYDEELREMVTYAETEAVGMTGRDWRFLRGLVLKNSPLFPWYARVHHAYAAALLGHEEAAAPLVGAAMHSHGELKRHAYDRAARDRMHTAMRAFHAGSRREELLAALEEAHVLYPESECDWEVVSLIGPVKRELAEGPPAYVRKRPEERNKEEQIRALIYEFREINEGQMAIPGYPDVFGRFGFTLHWNPARRLVEYGQKAIPFLIEALDDYTPTRTTGYRWHWRLLRRMDVAMHVIEKIAACDFYDEPSTSGDLHNDTPERRDSAVANVKKWWAMSEGKPQAEGMRNQLALWDENKTLRVYERIGALSMLSAVEGPERALGEVPKLPEKYRPPWGGEEGDPRGDALRRIDPRAAILAKFDRFRRNASKGNDLWDLLRYGDRKVYEKLARGFEATGKLDPSGERGHVRYSLTLAAKHGKNWAIPIVAHALGRTEMSGGPRGKRPRYSDADTAAEEFQKLVGRDLGYRREAAQEQRLAAIAGVREWLLGEGREPVAAKIAEANPFGEGAGDLFMSDEEIASCVAAISGDDVTLRRRAVAGLRQSLHFSVQRALLRALTRETEPGQRLAIPRALKALPRPWHLPGVVRLLESDPDAAVRREAARFVALLREQDASGQWGTLEPFRAAVRAARRVARDPRTPAEVRIAAARILMTRTSPPDLEVLRWLAADPAFRDFAKLHSHLRRMDETLERIRAAKGEQRKRR